MRCSYQFLGDRGMGLVDKGGSQLTVQAGGHVFWVGGEQALPDELVEHSDQLLLLRLLLAQ